jgi:PHD/YefM family antitoxin component YafN of YafNO toxin-antitoxin module
MLTYTADEAANRLDELLDRVQREPVQITRHTGTVCVIVLPEAFAAMRAFYADRLQRTLDLTALEAAAQGLTDAELTRLLAKESGPAARSHPLPHEDGATIKT